MNVLMVTPHLTPHHAPDAVHFVRRGSRRLRATRVPQAMEALRTWSQARPLLA